MYSMEIPHGTRLVLMLIVSLAPIHILGRHIKSRNSSITAYEPGASVKFEKEHIKKREACKTFPFDVKCHDRCPNVGDSDWTLENDKCKRIQSNKTYHCARDFHTGEFVGACLVPGYCEKGEEPVLKFPENIPDLECRPCKYVDKFYNSRRRKTDSYSRCYEKRTTCNAQDGQTECYSPKGDARYYTETNCTCDWRRDFLPDFSDRAFCSENILCYKLPCDKSSDGVKQERLSNFSCTAVCGDGFYPRTYDEDKCIPLESNVTIIYENTTSSTTSTTSNTTITTQPDRNITTTPPQNGNNLSAAVIAIPSAIVVSVIPILVCLYCLICKDRDGLVFPSCNYCTHTQADGRQNRRINGHSSEHERVPSTNISTGHQNRRNNGHSSEHERVPLTNISTASAMKTKVKEGLTEHDLTSAIQICLKYASDRRDGGG